MKAALLTDDSPRSIPHANSPSVNHTMSSSPTNNATSPIKESPLAEPEHAAFQEAEPALADEDAVVTDTTPEQSAEAETEAANESTE